jgi:hypothetical protein
MLHRILLWSCCIVFELCFLLNNVEANGDDSAEVVVFGRPVVYPIFRKTIPATYRIIDRPTYGKLLCGLRTCRL